LKKAYSGNATVMSGHDYQRVHAQMLAQFSADSRRRPKIKANNKALRQRERLVQKADIAEQFEERLPKSSVSPLPIGDSDDDFSPAPRRGLT
jgi:putative transposase